MDIESGCPRRIKLEPWLWGVAQWSDLMLLPCKYIALCFIPVLLLHGLSIVSVVVLCVIPGTASKFLTVSQHQNWKRDPPPHKAHVRASKLKDKGTQIKTSVKCEHHSLIFDKCLPPVSTAVENKHHRQPIGPWLLLLFAYEGKVASLPGTLLLDHPEGEVSFDWLNLWNWGIILLSKIA